MVLACDGVYDVFSNDELAMLLRAQIAEKHAECISRIPSRIDAAEMFSGIYAAMTDLFCYFYFSLACPQDSRAGLPRFARPGRDWIHLVYI